MKSSTTKVITARRLLLAFWLALTTSLLVGSATQAGLPSAAGCPGARPIAEARRLPEGSNVTVRGVVTVPTGAFSSDRSFALQDATGGLYVFRQAGIGQALAVGDEVCVSGRLALYHDLLELMPRSPAEIVRIGRATPPSALIVPPRQVGKANEGRLVTITGIITRFGERRFFVEGAIVFVYEATGISLTGLQPGCRVTVTGFSGNYDGPQVWPRSQADIVPGPCDAPSMTPTPAAASCPNTQIWQLQGPGDATPFDPEARFGCLEGCVTGVTSEGFFVQSLRPDDNPNTSEGIYIYRFSGWRNPRDLKPGTRVMVQNFSVQEFYGQTEIVKLSDDTQASYRVLGACALPQAVPIAPLSDPAADPVRHFEPLEGMRVSMSFVGSVVGPTQRYPSRYPAGDPEITLALQDSPFYGQRILADELPPDRGTLALSGALGIDLPDVGTFDRISATDLTGILAFQFGRYVLLVDDPTPLRVEDLPDAKGEVAPIGQNEFAICTYNAENLFDHIDDGDGDMGDWTPRDAAAFQAALATDARVIAETLRGCTIIGLQEVEGKEEVWTQLAQAVGPRYRYDYFESMDARDITVGILYDGTRVTLRRADQAQTCGAEDYQVQYMYAVGARSRTNPCTAGTYPLFDRPPYVADLTVQDETGRQRLDLRVVVVHLKSKRGDETVNLPRRVAQAAFVNTLLNRPLAVALGDFNDSLGSQPLAQFPGRVNLWERYVAPSRRYSYIYQGRAEAIDHFVMTPGLERHFLAGGPVHINADFPERLETTPNGGRSSDHDPLFVRFSFRPTGLSDALVGAVAGALDHTPAR